MCVCVCVLQQTQSTCVSSGHIIIATGIDIYNIDIQDFYVYYYDICIHTYTYICVATHIYTYIYVCNTHNLPACPR